MPPIVSEIEPVAERLIDLQAERSDGGLGNIPSHIPLVRIEGIRQHVPLALRVVRPLAELELVHVLVETVERLKDGVVQVLQRLVTPDLDGTRDFRISLEELLTDRAADDEDIQV